MSGDFPDIKSKHSLVAKHVTKEKWDKLGPITTKTSGFTLAKAIACAVEFDNQARRIYSWINSHLLHSLKSILLYVASIPSISRGALWLFTHIHSLATMRQVPVERDKVLPQMAHSWCVTSAKNGPIT